jgi:hypothetical protein
MQPQPDLPTAADKLSLQNTTVGEAREHVINFLTEHWKQSLITLAAKLTAQGFSQEETLELCESFRPRFDESLTNAIAVFDANADEFIATCADKEGRADG